MIVDELFDPIGDVALQGIPVVLVGQNVHKAIRLTI
jgi:hypothetical protein